MLSQASRPPVSFSPHPLEVAIVLDTIIGILATSAAVIGRAAKKGNICLSAATLDRVSALSELIWEEVSRLPLSTIPSLQKFLTIYELILVDIQQILGSSSPLEISDDTINRRLDDLRLQLREALDILKGTAGQRSPTNSTHFFPNSHHIIISGGNFFSNNPVLYDPVVREQIHKILQVAYIQCGVLFA